MRQDEIVLQQLVDLAVGIPKFTYPMYVNAPRPDGEFAGVKLKSSRNPGYDTVSYVEKPEGLFMKTEGNRILNFFVLFSRDDVEVINFDNSFLRQDMRDLAYKAGYSLMDKRPTTIENTVFETNWEIQTGIEVMMMTNRIQETPVGTIGTLELGGEYNDSGSNIAHKLNFKVGE